MKLRHKPYSTFKGKLKELGVKYSEIAELLGISVTSVGLKINGQTDFTVTEAVCICQKYGITPDVFVA